MVLVADVLELGRTAPIAYGTQYWPIRRTDSVLCSLSRDPLFLFSRVLHISQICGTVSTINHKVNIYLPYRLYSKYVLYVFDYKKR